MKLKYFVRTGNGNYHKMLIVPAELRMMHLTVNCILHAVKGTYRIDDIIGDSVYLTKLD